MTDLIKIILPFLLSTLPCFAAENSLMSGFGDKDLNYYINGALVNNHEYKKTESLIEAYRQRTLYARGDALPAVSLAAQYIRGSLPGASPIQLKDNIFLLPLTVSWEPDIFGKNSKKTESARKAYDIAAVKRTGTEILLVSEIAAAYIGIIEYDALIKNQEEIINLASDKLERTRKMLTSGITDNKAVMNGEQALEKLINELKVMKLTRDAAINNFSVLTGTAAAEDMPRGDFSGFEYRGQIRSGIKSDSVYGRPDIMEIEKRLEQLNVNTETARKELLPVFSITGLISFNNAVSDEFFDWDNSVRGVMGQLKQDLYAGGRKKANIKIKEAEYKAAFEDYRQTALEAFNEINTAMIHIRYNTDIYEATKNLSDIEYKKRTDSEIKFSRGVISYPEFLDAEISYLLSAQEVIKRKAEKLIDYITLYKATGGNL